MFPTFIGILDIQSWWEVPSIAHFCSLFRAAFNLLDFDIEDLEEALLTDGGTEGRLLQELIVRLLEGCLPNESRNDISTFNYQMFLRRLFRKKCQDYKCENPFNTDVDFELLPLRQKVEILRALCDFRLDAVDVELALSNLDSDSLRVEPLGHDRKNSAYWYFYGTRLYREDYIDNNKELLQKQRGKTRDKKRKKRRVRGEKLVEKEEEEENEIDNLINFNSSNIKRETVWQVVCFTQQDWTRLVDKFKDSDHDTERKLYHTLAEDFLPEIPKLFELKEKQQRIRLLERNNLRVGQRGQEPAEPTEQAIMVRAKMKTKSKSNNKKGQSAKPDDSDDDIPPPAVPQPPPPPQKKGRQTNNSLASADGQIVIHTRDEMDGIVKKGVAKNNSTYVASYPYTFGIEEEERRVGMHKVLESLKDHVDAWPFIDPVDEEYAPRYYSVVRKPMDLSTMEEKLDGGSYKNLSLFKRDFRLIVDNCRQYNGSDNEYTEMAVNLKEAFDRAVDRYLESEPSSDESPSLPTSPNAVPSSPYPARATSSPSLLSNTRKRNKKSKQKSKSNKNDKKYKNNKLNKNDDIDNNVEDYDNDDEDDDNVDDSPRDRRGRKRSKRAREEEERVNDDNLIDENGAISECSVIKSKRKKYNEVEKLLPKNNKKLSAKEEKSDDNNKRGGRNRQKDVHDKNIKEHKDNRKKKDDFEEDHEPLINIKSKNKRLEKKGIDGNLGLTDRIKKKQPKKQIYDESDDDDNDRLSEFDDENDKQSPERKKNRKKDKASQKNVKIDEKHDRKLSKEKDKKSKTKKNDERPKNGEVKKTNDKEIKKEDTASKKFDSLVSNKDLESLDSLKDRISERRREEKLKIEREKAKKSSKIDNEKKKVPSNGNTYHDSAKVNLKRAKLKKSIKDEKILPIKEDNLVENKKIKMAHGKNSKNREESPAIQALNQATEQTLNDINKWLDDAPKLTEFSSGSDSPQNKQPSTSDTVARISKPELPRKRPGTMKFLGPNGPPRPKKVQRTIDRLQPGKAKGNLLLKKPSVSGNSDAAASQSTSDADKPSKDTTEEPKLSLGTVLKNADSIQLICKSLVSSPNPNLSNEDDDEDRPIVPAASRNLDDEKTKETTNEVTPKIESDDVNNKKTEESQKPKSATPNLSAWFKAFGAPKSKKKEDEADDVTKKEEIQEIPQRQRRLSAGGSSVSESVSSFSQESPPGLTIRSPQSQPALTPTAIEQPIRAGFYQDALSTGSSPNNSPYYATPPRYSAQLPPTPSPQNYSHPLSPAYPSSAAYDQNPLYPQIPQASHQVYQKPATPENPSETYNTYPQNSPQNDNYQQQIPNQKPSPVYPQPSPQPLSVYPQPSPQPPPANYSQPSPQQPTTPNYSQPSPQQPAANYSQPSPQNPPPTYSQPSPQQQHSPYSQPSPQPPPNYSQPSPQQPNSPYSQPSPKPPPTYSQVSPQAPSPYSQPSPQFAQPSPQPPPNYSQPSPQTPPNYSQPSPGSRNFSQHSPQPPTYSQPSPQSLNYSQPSPQQPPKYSQPSPQAPPNYSQHSPQQSAPPASTVYTAQVSPQPSRNYTQPSPQTACVLPPSSRPPANYSQLSPRQTTPQNYQKLEDYPPSSTENYPQGFKQNHTTYAAPAPTAPEPERRVEYLKPEEKIQPLEQPRNFPPESSLGLNTNHQVYQSNQFPPAYTNNYPPPTDPQRSAARLNPPETPQQPQERHFDPEALKYAQQRQDQSQLLSFQQNLPGHEAIYQPAGGFQAPTYPMPNPSCRPVYPSPHYYDASAKSSGSTSLPPSSVASTLAPVKKRMYNEPTSDASRSLPPDQQSRPTQEQFGYDQMMTLVTSESVVGQFDGGFGTLADSVAGNSAYARLGLGLVGRSPKDQQQLLSIPRPSSKDALAYARQTGSSELDLNLLQSLQNAAAKNMPAAHARRESAVPVQTAPPPKVRKSKKKAQQQQQQQQQQNQASNLPDQQQPTSMPGFPQYPGNPGDPIGLKNPTSIPPGGSAFNFATPPGTTNSSPFYDKDASAAAAAFAFLDEFRNPNNYYSILRQQQGQQQTVTPVTESGQQANKLNNQPPPRNYPPHPFLHSTQRSAPYGPPVSAYVTPHGPNLGVDPAAYQQYIHSLYALQPPSHHHRPSWL